MKRSLVMVCLLVGCGSDAGPIGSGNNGNSDNNSTTNGSNQTNNIGGNNSNNHNNIVPGNNSNNSNNGTNGYVNNTFDMGYDVSVEDVGMNDAGPDGSPDEVVSGPVNFFVLPTGAIRFAASMVVPEKGFSVSLIWSGGRYPWCAENFEPPAVYAYIEPKLNPETWDYNANATYSNVEGCVNIDGEDLSSSTIDITLDLTSEVWSGTLHFEAP